MSRSTTCRRTVQPILQSLRSPLQRFSFAQGVRPFSQTCLRRADSNDDGAKKPPPKQVSESLIENLYGLSQAYGRPAQSNAMASLSQSVVFQAFDKSNIDTSSLSGGIPRSIEKKEDEIEPYHFHVFSHKHNTHITCTKPNREPIISMSCGNIGFRKSRRGTFDSAYSLTKYVLERLIHTGWPMKIARLELVLQGFGQGREAVVKVLMSPEGKILRDKIVRVADATRIKFGGTRSEKPRRL